MRILGIDYGAKRVGLAISDPLCIAAHGLRTVERSDDESVLKEIAALVAEHGVEEIVIGLPKNMDDTLGAEAQRAMAFAEAVRLRFSLPVHMVDERLTSERAERSLREANVSYRDRRGKRDRIAAQLILQIHLDQKGRAT